MEELNSKKIIVICSGGMDSISMLYRLKKEKYKIKAISFNYGQRHKKELEMAKKNCEMLEIEHNVIDIRSITKFISNSALTGNIEVPEGHYEQKNMSLTVVPSRNTIMLAIASGYAINIGYNAIAIGIHSGDHQIYPDCRPEFIKAMNDVFKINNYKKVKILTPYLNANKTKIIKDGLKNGVNYIFTWTCYKGGKKACGKCGSCRERLEAFKNNKIEDPLQYETREIL